MEDPPFEMRTLIHHVLHRHNIYSLELTQLKEILYLLEQPCRENPVEIQEAIFRGVIKFNHTYK
jgi:hypothetical protein